MSELLYKFKKQKPIVKPSSTRDFLWNPKTREFLGRTGLSWAKITIFYVIFYAGLASFFGVCFYFFMLTLDADAPKWQQSSSVIGTNPGMGYRPMPDPDSNAQSTLIWYQRGNEADTKFWYQQIEKFIQDVDNPMNFENVIECEYNETNTATKENACRVDVTAIRPPCSKQNHFGYPDGEPCILLKLNKIYGWQPHAFGLNQEGEFDEDLLITELNEQVAKGMPLWLKHYIIRELSQKYLKHTESFLNTVWFSCNGESPADQENIGTLQYFPQPGIPGFYFPYLKQGGYQTPFVFLRLVRPTPNVLINIECKAWARNIQHDRQMKTGSVHFEVMID